METGFKGTKGEWVATPNTCFYDIDVLGNSKRILSFNIILFDNEKGEAISLSEENKANAQLIATAPEMLEALVTIKAELLRCDILDERTEKFIDDVVSKATGGQS